MQVFFLKANVILTVSRTAARFEEYRGENCVRPAWALDAEIQDYIYELNGY